MKRRALAYTGATPHPIIPDTISRPVMESEPPKTLNPRAAEVHIVRETNMVAVGSRSAPRKIDTNLKFKVLKRWLK